MDKDILIKGNFRKTISSKFYIYGLMVKNEALTIFENEYLNGYPPYESLENFLHFILDIIINKLNTESSLIDKELTEIILKQIHIVRKDKPIISHELVIRNVNCEQTNLKESHLLHIKFLRSLCDKFVEFLENSNSNNAFEIKNIGSVKNTFRSTLNCNVFGFLKKNLSKLNEYIFEDETGSVVIEFNNESEKKNNIILENSFLLVDGTFHSLANVLFVNKIGYLPCKLNIDLNETEKDDKLKIQSLESNMFVIIKDAFLNERTVLEKLKILFTTYNSVTPLPHFFIFIGPFTSVEVDKNELKELFQFFFRIILTCPNISKNSSIIIVPGVENNDNDFIKTSLFDINEFQLNELNVNFTTNPCNLYVNDKHICIFSSNYFQSVKKRILFRKKVTDEEFYNEFCNIILSNFYLTPGLSKNFSNSMNLFHYPDLLIFADNSIIEKEISFKLLDRCWIINTKSFANNNFKFKVYYSDSSLLEDSQINF